MSTVVVDDQRGDVPDASVLPTATKWAAICAGLTFLITLTQYNLSDGDPNAGAEGVVGLILSALSIAVVVGSFVLGLRAFRDGANGGLLSFGTGAKWVAVFALVSAVLVALYMYLIFAVIFPGMQEAMLEAVAQQMEQQSVPEEQEEAMEALAQTMASPLTWAGGAALSALVMYGIIGLIVAAVLKNR